MLAAVTLSIRSGSEYSIADSLDMIFDTLRGFFFAAPDTRSTNVFLDPGNSLSGRTPNLLQRVCILAGDASDLNFVMIWSDK